jgi:predicted ArsR family transcriptional regulator
MRSLLPLEHSSTGKILTLLQQHGPCDIKDMTAALRITRTAVQQPLRILCAADLVTATSVRHGRGRPPAVYQLSVKGQELFPQLYEELACILFEELLVLPANTHWRQILPRLSARLGAQYADQSAGTTLLDRVQTLAAWLVRRGVLTSVEEHEQTFLLMEHSCPFYGLARLHREVCTMETTAMMLALGTPVTLGQSRLDGHTGCQFLIQKTPAQNVTPLQSCT